MRIRACIFPSLKTVLEQWDSVFYAASARRAPSSTTIVVSTVSWIGPGGDAVGPGNPVSRSTIGPEALPASRSSLSGQRQSGYGVDSNHDQPGSGASSSSMWIVRLALRRPYTFVVFALLILILGVFSILSMPTDIFPNIDIPVVTVVWKYHGPLRASRWPTASSPTASAA